VVVFSGDTDMATMGLISLSSIEKTEVVIAYDCGTDEVSFAERLSASLNRNDLRLVPFLRAEQLRSVTPGTSFQEFRAAYRGPRLVYRCPYCRGGEAIAEEEQSFSGFARGGGTITLVGELSIAD
jgi:hypothetical protein